MGTEVEGAIRPTDSRTFICGHALAKYKTGETRGIGSNQARVWSIKRASIDQFKDWCDRVAVCIKNTGDSHLPNVEFLPSPEPIVKFKGKPLAIYMRWDPTLSVSFSLSGSNIEIESISFEKLSLSVNKEEISGTINIGEGRYAEVRSFTYSLALLSWQFTRDDIPLLRVDDGQEFHFKSVSEFLEAFPPIIILEDGSTVIDGCRFEPRRQLPSIPEDCIDNRRSWERCDISVEFEYIDKNDPRKSRIPESGKLTVHEQVEEWFKEQTSIPFLVIKDHAKGEIADYIEIQESDSLIRFYHCKACSIGKSPGARINELKALEQALRSIDYIGSNTLLSELYSRVIGKNRPDTKMVIGTSDSLKNIAKKFHANEWKFEVAIVNPGISCKKSIHTKNTNTLLTACFEWLGAANARLCVIGK
jgi:hypothetical protein